jgi:hypothetical protein
MEFGANTSPHPQEELEITSTLVQYHYPVSGQPVIFAIMKG